MALSTPDSEPRLFSGPGAGLRLVLLVTLAIALMWLDHRNQHLVQIRGLIAATLYPLQEAVDAPFTASRWARESLASRDALIEDNASLRETLLVQAARLQRMAALEAENARMRALLESTAKVGDQVLIAEIVSVDMDRLRHRVVLNRGSRDGAFVGQALIDASGVVGQITRDRGTSSEALLITDPDHAVPVEVVRNGLRTVALGTGDLERLTLPFMARNADVKAGDLLVSSGLGGKFPPGYPVATVTEVRGDSGEPFLVVNAHPAAALDRVREVLLVIPSSAPAAEPADAQASSADAARSTAAPEPQQQPSTGVAPAAARDAPPPAAGGARPPAERGAPAPAPEPQPAGDAQSGEVAGPSPGATPPLPAELAPDAAAAPQTPAAPEPEPGAPQ
jgi:rod shape-determining protein MreC